MIEASATTVSTSAADDLAFRALADICDATRGLDVRIVGGQMVGLLLTAFPHAEAVPRRTADADAAISTQLAAAGGVHDLLLGAGYEATSGNSYTKNGQQIDLLVPAAGGRFHTEQLGGRMFDAAPGISLAIAIDPISITVDVTLTDDTALEFNARVPSVEGAVVLKAISYRSRLAAKDLTDLHNLLWIVDSREADAIGGWRLNEPSTGARRDAQRALAGIATTLAARRARSEMDVRPELLSALIRTHVAVTSV